MNYRNYSNEQLLEIAEAALNGEFRDELLTELNNRREESFADEAESERMAEEREPREDHFRDDVEADADALAGAGFGTDEDYGFFGGGDD